MSAHFPNLHDKVSRWAFNGRLGRSLGALLDLQMWCFGCDIRRPEGNFLLQSGFKKISAGKIYGSSHYHQSFEGVRSLHLWGFGIVACEKEVAISLRRHERTPLFAERVRIGSDIHRPHELPRFSSPVTEESRRKACDLLLLVATQLESYESSVLACAGAEYRDFCVGASRRHRKLRGLSLREAWGELSGALNDEMRSPV